VLDVMEVISLDQLIMIVSGSKRALTNEEVTLPSLICEIEAA